MAKETKKDVVLPVKTVEPLETGTYENPIPWIAPYPTSKLDKDGKTELVFVRATTTQDIILNGKMYAAGIHTLPCNFAHANVSVLGAPK